MLRFCWDLGKEQGKASGAFLFQQAAKLALGLGMTALTQHDVTKFAQIQHKNSLILLLLTLHWCPVFDVSRRESIGAYEGKIALQSGWKLLESSPLQTSQAIT